MPPFSAKSFSGRRRVLWLLIVFAATAICLGSIVAMMIYADAHDTVTAQNLVAHTQEVRLTLAAASEQLDRIELNAELYSYVGDKGHLGAAEQASVSLDSLAARLKVLVVPTSEQEQETVQLQAAAATLALRVDGLKNHWYSVESDVVACRRILTVLQEQEGVLLEQRDAAARRENLNAMIRRAIVIVVGTILILVLFGFLIRDAVRSGHFEKRLSRTNDQLRNTVGRLEEQAFESRLLINARDEVSLSVDARQAEECTVRYFSELIPGTAGSLYVTNNSRQIMESVGSWGVVRASAPVEGFAPECCCALRSGRPRWRRPEQSVLHCTHFLGEPPERYLCLPVTAHGETLGVVTIECQSHEAITMTETREESAISLAEMAAMAISGLRLRERLELQSIRDGMTGVFNRSFMEVALDRELHRSARQQKELALMMVDIDHFKQFNDTFGHEAGDLVLRLVADSLRQGVRTEDIVCRFGGEEFVIILPEMTPDSAVERAEALRQQVKQLAPRFRGQPLRQVTISIGLALAPQNGEGAEELLRCADRAMYTAKHRGRNQVVQIDSGILA